LGGDRSTVAMTNGLCLQPVLPGLEADYVHDVVYDYYGTRLALCTSRHRISIYSLPVDGDSSWTETARMDKAHSQPIWRLSWSHPDNGDLLASCSEDGSIRVWANPGRAVSDDSAELPRRDMRKQLAMEGPCVDLRFAPVAYGCKIAACTSKGRTRVWDCTNSLDLRCWESADLDSPGVPPDHSGLSAALDWMPPVPGDVAPSEDREVLAVAGRNGRLAIWVKNKSMRWTEQASVEAHPIASGGVKDVAWCPNLCRPHEIIATCGAGAALWRVKFLGPDERRPSSNVGSARKDSALNCQVQQIIQLVPTSSDLCPVWRCSWNLTGTNLSLCTDSEELQLWRVGETEDWVRDDELATVVVLD